jgi:hypothetical protein
MTLSSQGATHDYKNNSTNIAGLVNKAENFYFSWREVVPTIIKIGLSVHNYKMKQVSYFFSYSIDIQNVMNNGMNIYIETFQSASTWVYFLTFNVIVVTVESQSI